MVYVGLSPVRTLQGKAASDRALCQLPTLKAAFYLKYTEHFIPTGSHKTPTCICASIIQIFCTSIASKWRDPQTQSKNTFQAAFWAPLCPCFHHPWLAGHLLGSDASVLLNISPCCVLLGVVDSWAPMPGCCWGRESQIPQSSGRGHFQPSQNPAEHPPLPGLSFPGPPLCSLPLFP